MTEENNETKEVEKTEGSAQKDPKEGVQSETISELDRADQIAERQKRENDRREELLNREEALEARRTVGGVTEAGKPVETKKETDSEYRQRIDKELAEGKFN